MSKTSGLGDNLYIAQYDLSGDTNAIGDIGGGNEPYEKTGIDKSAYERIGGRRDGRINWESFFNPDAGQAHAVYSALPTTDVLISYFRGTALGSPAASLVAKQANYDGDRGDDGDFNFEVDAMANGFGLNWGRQLTAGKRTDVAAADGTGVDFGAENSFGLQAFLHVFSFTGTDITIALEESSDDDSSDPYAAVTGGAFTTVTGPTFERIQTARDQTVEQWLRVSTSGTFSECTFAVVVAVNEVEVLF